MTQREEANSRVVLEVKVRADLLMEFAYASRAIVEEIETGGLWGLRAEALRERWDNANHALCRGLEFVHDA